MIGKLAHLVLNNLTVNKKINPEHREIYAFALENFISALITWLVFSLTAIILGVPDKMLIFVAFYAPIRKFAGGFHANTRGGCLLLSLLSTLFLICLSILISKSIIWYVGPIICILVSIFLVFAFAPVDHPNRRLSLEKKHLNKRVSRFIIIAESILVVIGILVFNQWKDYIVTASMALLLEGVVLIPYKLQKEEKNHEKSQVASNKDV